MIKALMTGLHSSNRGKLLLSAKANRLNWGCEHVSQDGVRGTCTIIEVLSTGTVPD